MLKGIHLTLMIGPAVPIPAPQSVMDALTSVQVTSGKDRSGFQITFAVSKKSPLLTTHAAGRLLRSDRDARDHHRDAERHSRTC